MKSCFKFQNLFFAAILVMATTGCRWLHSKQALMGPPFVPENVFVAGSRLPDEMRRIALLPVAIPEESSAFVEGRESLAPLVAAELNKTRKFEVVALTPMQVQRATGREFWSGEETLPADFMEKIVEATRCDAVFFCQLSTFRAHPPLSVGWRMKLVDVRFKQIFWAADETFDAGNPSVQSGAWHYRKSEFKTMESGDWLMENSPRYFGQYTIARLLETLPAR